MLPIPSFLYGFTVIFFTIVTIQLIRFTRRLYKREREVIKLEKQYANLREKRNNLLHHYHWNKQDGNTKNQEEYQQEVVRVSKKMECLLEEIKKLDNKKKVKSK